MSDDGHNFTMQSFILTPPPKRENVAGAPHFELLWWMTSDVSRQIREDNVYLRCNLTTVE